MAKIYSHQLQHFWETEYPEFWFYFCVLTFHWQHWLYWLFSDLLLSSLCLEMESCTCFSEEQQNDGSFHPSFSLAHITSFSISSPLIDGENEPYSCLLLLPSRFSHVRLCATPQMAAYQAPPSLGFSRQAHWSGLPFPSPMHESEKWKWSRSVMSNS